MLEPKTYAVEDKTPLFKIHLTKTQDSKEPVSFVF